MVSHLFYYQLALFVLVWLFVMLHLTWSKPGVTIPSMPAKPRRRRTSELKPIAGLTEKPHCALCERDTRIPNHLLPGRPTPCPRRITSSYRGYLHTLLSS